MCNLDNAPVNNQLMLTSSVRCSKKFPDRNYMSHPSVRGNEEGRDDAMNVDGYNKVQ